MRCLSSASVVSLSSCFGHLDAGEARRGTLRRVAGDLHLAGERKHVRKQARLREHRGIDLFRLGMCGGFVDDGRQIGETAHQDGDRDIVERNAMKYSGVIEGGDTVTKMRGG